MIIRGIVVLLLLFFSLPMTVNAYRVFRYKEYKSRLTGETIKFPSSVRAYFIGIVLTLSCLFFYFMIYVVLFTSRNA